MLSLLSSLLATRCLLCSAVSLESVCKECLPNIGRRGAEANLLLRCYRCDEEFDGQEGCQFCRQSQTSPFRFIRSLCLLTPELRQLIHAGKYQGHFRIFRQLGDLLLAYHLASMPRYLFYDTIISMPSYWRHRHERGFCHTTILARPFMSHFGAVGLMVKNVGRRRHALMTVKQRITSSKHKFCLPEKGIFCKQQVRKMMLGRVLLIDDIVTSGASAVAVATLISLQAQSIDLLTVARSENFAKYFPMIQ